MTEAPQMVSGFGQFHTDEEGATKRTPYTAITWAGVQALVDNPQQVPKADAQWLIPSVLPSRKFLRQEAEGEFWLLWADFDMEPRGTAAVGTALAMHCVGTAQVEVYSSRSATAEVPKCRALVPLCQPLSGPDWVLAQQVLNDLLEGAKLIPDRVSERTGQLCYLPNRSAFYEVNSRRTGKLFDPLTFGAHQN